jgi:serine protease Do/serine protease DegQ
VAQVYGLTSAQGALVTQVVEGSAAERAGIQSGDIITNVNGAVVKSPAELRNAIGLLRVGDHVELTVLRDGKPLRVAAVIAAPPGAEASAAPEPPVNHMPLEGLKLEDAPGMAGVMVRGVEPDSPAARSGLRSNDLIVGVNRAPVTNLHDLQTHSQGAATLVLEVRRGTSRLVLPVH